IDAAAPLGGRFVGVLLPERGSDEALGFARELAALPGRISVGVATAPHDGIDPDAVLGAARAACAAAEPGAVLRAGDTVEVITAGAQRIMIADPAMARLYELARRLARAAIPILILGETGELSPAVQAKLLRALENGELTRVGETAPRTVDLRIVAATNRDLERE